MAKRWKLIGLSLVVLLLVVSVGFYAWTRLARYAAFPEAAALAAEARTERGWYVYEPDGGPRAGFIFYPGGLVDPQAYAPLMQRLSDGGVRAVVVPMPLDLAVFGSNRADAVIAAYPDVDTWVIGGHSLGGAMSAEYLKKNPDAVDGIVFLAAYPAGSTDLSRMKTKALSVYGTNDRVARDDIEASMQRLPATELVVIEGGNHAQFGDYGPQKGDGAATVSRDEQQRLTADAIIRLVRGLE